MILVDTSVWLDHFHHTDEMLLRLLDSGLVLSHPFVIGEIAMGRFKSRNSVLGKMSDLPQAVTADPEEVLAFISEQALFGRGISYVDAHLLAAAKLTSSATLWTRDKRLLAAAVRLDLDYALGNATKVN